MNKVYTVILILVITSCANRSGQLSSSNGLGDTVSRAIAFTDSVFSSRREELLYSQDITSEYLIIPILNLNYRVPSKDSIAGNPLASDLVFDESPECNESASVLYLMRDAPCDTVLAIVYLVDGEDCIHRVAIYRESVVDVTGTDPSLQRPHRKDLRVLLRIKDRWGHVFDVRNVLATVGGFVTSDGRVWGGSDRGRRKPFKDSLEDEVYVR